jgi:tRNA modification GTPase
VLDGELDRSRDAHEVLERHGFVHEDGTTKTLVVVNKIDRTLEPAGVEGTTVRVSASTGAGVPQLRSAIRAQLGLGDAAPRFLARRRHLDALGRTRDALERVAALLLDVPQLELAAEELRAAQHHLGEIVGDVGSDDLLGEIFGRFCIGK